MQIRTVSGKIFEIKELRDMSICIHTNGISVNPFSDLPQYNCDTCGKSLTVEQVKLIYESGKQSTGQEKSCQR